jgi:hypothetical protein
MRSWPMQGVFPGIHLDITNMRGNVDINVTLRRLRVTTVAVEKQEILHILSVCL